MNIGGDPGRDDYGLPPVDIEIPDDARELDRDVQAYHRELRAQRWRRRTRRLAGPLTRDGMVLPLLAGCLALTLLAGTLLTVFSGAQLTGRAPGRADHQLPNATVLVDGVRTPLRQLRGLVLALVPAGCRCADLPQLAREAGEANVPIYIAGRGRALVADLVKRTRPGAHAVEDTNDALMSTYNPVILTAVLVKDDGSVARVALPDRKKGFQLTSALRSLVPHPGGTGMATVAAGPAGG